ncbi:unnamed protein product [Amoebophrya sp. A25]|nr:unnamed protein product [Amoebophrya sp. A25]|eukprot:GSA25T00007113001.1
MHRQVFKRYTKRKLALKGNKCQVTGASRKVESGCLHDDDDVDESQERVPCGRGASLISKFCDVSTDNCRGRCRLTEILPVATQNTTQNDSEIPEDITRTTTRTLREWRTL